MLFFSFGWKVLVVQVSLECKYLFLAYGFALIWFFFNGSWSFVLIFALSQFWLEIGRESSYSDLASWAKGPEDKGLNHCKYFFRV